MIRRPPCPTLFPYTTLFRSQRPIGKAVSLDRLRAKARVDCARGPSVPSMLIGRPSTMPTAERSAASASNAVRSEEHTSELQSRQYLVCRLLLEKKKTIDAF